MPDLWGNLWGFQKGQAIASCKLLNGMAGTTGLEPAASAVTGQRSNQLNYVPFLLFMRLGSNPHVYCLFMLSTVFACFNPFRRI